MRTQQRNFPDYIYFIGTLKIRKTDKLSQLTYSDRFIQKKDQKFARGVLVTPTGEGMERRLLGSPVPFHSFLKAVEQVIDRFFGDAELFRRQLAVTLTSGQGFGER